MTTRIEERMQDEWKKLGCDRDKANQMHDRIFQLKTQRIQVQGEGKILQQRIQDLEAANLHQANEIQYRKQQGKTQARDNLRMATLDPKLATPKPPSRYKEERENEERYSTPHREYRRNADEGDHRHGDQGYSTPQRPNSNHWNVNPQTIKPRQDPTNGRYNERDNDSTRNEERLTRRASEKNNPISREERAAAELSIRGFEKKYSTIVELTDKPSKLSIETMYRHLAHQANNSGLPMRSINEVERGHPIYPESATYQLHPQVLERYSATPFHKLEILVPETVLTNHDIVAQNTSSKDGYTTLYQILRTILPKLQDFPTKWGPTLDKNQDMYRFVRIMQEHATSEAEFDRPYNDIKIITNIIQHALDDTRYEMTARTAKATIQSALAQGTRVTLTMQNIAQSLEPSQTTHQARDGDTPTMYTFDVKIAQRGIKQQSERAHSID